MIVTDPHFTINHLNRRATELLGYTFTDVHKIATPLIWLNHDQLVERAAKYTIELGEFVPADCTALVIRTLRHLKEDSEWIWHHRDGTRLFVQLSVSAITHPGAISKATSSLPATSATLKKAMRRRCGFLRLWKAPAMPSLHLIRWATFSI